MPLILALLVSVPVLQQPQLPTTLLIDSINRNQGILPLTTEGLSMARLIGESPNALTFLCGFLRPRNRATGGTGPRRRQRWFERSTS